MLSNLPEKNNLSISLRRSICCGLLLFCIGYAQNIRNAESAIKRITGKAAPAQWLLVSADKQKMYLIQNSSIADSFVISTAENGTDSNATDGSKKTPLGLHYIEAKIGSNAPEGTIFRAKQNTGKIAVIRRVESDPYAPEDLVLTRVLPLMGMEPGLNKGKNKRGKSVDSFRRAIYIHGTNNEADLGIPKSHGCIRMYNKDVIRLFETAETGMFVLIVR